MEEWSDNKFGWWLSGFVDGEGSFTYKRRRGQAEPVFAIRLRDDSGETLCKIAQRLKCGDVYYSKPQISVNSKGKTAHSNPQAYFVVVRKSDLLALVRHFDKYPPLQEKQEDYEIWRELVLEFNKNAHLRDKRLMLRLGVALSSVKEYREPGEEETIGVLRSEWNQMGFDALIGGSIEK